MFKCSDTYNTFIAAKRHNINSKAVSVCKKIAAGAVALSSVSAFADVPADVTTALTGAGTDAATLGAAVLVVLIGIFAFKLLRRAL